MNRHPGRSCTGFIALLVCLLLVPAQPAHAQRGDVADEAQFFFDRGNDHYRKADFAAALSDYYTSNRLVANRNVQFNIARCLERLGQHREAFRMWSTLSAAPASDDEHKQIEASIDKLRPHLALVEVTSVPPGATIYLDRKDLGSLGQTPKLLALPEGKAELILDLPGYRPAVLPIAARNGQQAVLQAPLAQIFGTLEFRRLPAGAELRRDLVDGPLVHKGPGVVRLPPGRVVLFASAPGFETVRLEADVRADLSTRVDVPMVSKPPPTGAIVVQANLHGSLVRVDGREMGFTPAVIEQIPVGSREVEVSHEGRELWRQTVTVEDGGRVYLDVKLRRLDATVSAATKSATRAEDAPASITVVTADEIAAFGWTTVAEVLSGVRGAFSSYDRIYQSAGFRGVSPPGDYTNRVLVLLDGHPMNDVLVGQGWVGHDLDVDLQNVERIEIVRGPSSALYGTAALFGVVNVVTRGARRGVHGEAGVGAGTLGYSAGRVTGSVAGENAELRVTAAAMRRIGDRTFVWDDGNTTSRNADEEQARHVGVTGRWSVLSLRAGWNDRRKDDPTGAYDVQPRPGTRYRDQRSFAELRADVPTAGFTISGRVAYDESRFRGRYLLQPDPAAPGDDSTLAEELRARWLTGELRLVTPVLLRQRFTVGAEVQSQFKLDLDEASRAAQQAAGAENELVLSGYLLDDVQIASWLRANAGVRVDRYRNNFGTTVNPRLALIARPYARGNTKLMAGRSFRAPSTYERFYNDGGETQKQAVSLDPETIASVELEHAHGVTDDVTLVAAGFAHQVDDLIVLDTDPADDLLVYRNQPGTLRGVGAEGEFRWEPGTGTRLSVAYTFQRVRQVDNGQSTPFVNAPGHLFAIRSIIELLPGFARLGNELVFDLGRHTRDGVRVEDAALWNLTLSGAFARHHLRYFAGIFNLLDVTGPATGFPVGYEVPGATVSRYGRAARIGLSYHY